MRTASFANKFAFLRIHQIKTIKTKTMDLMNTHTLPLSLSFMQFRSSPLNLCESAKHVIFTHSLRFFADAVIPITEISHI